MNKVRFAVSSTLLLLLALFFIQPLPADTGEEPIEIQVSPQTILLNWKALGAVEEKVKITVHADVNFSLGFQEFNVSLGGVTAENVFSDDRGDLVAKFNFRAIADLVGEPTATLTLKALSTGGVTYVGSDEVRVMDK